ncbi:glycoside hydrolase family 65 protein [Actinomycetaceae bacterium WB03_NA08]|uniref:Glycoside hydrolase family 65 protein n=1 Tax=Scrofimicrobium canadense TaxID=2652290 RepID=A0A6N7W7Q3_9ACTO|nr:glycoside hydrolase family 65 protein [Scrofimicrobium canadense]MSS85421.1 glycoside hydrolase family 65 protein [Scrofimicrobium canadense]
MTVQTALREYFEDLESPNEQSGTTHLLDDWHVTQTHWDLGTNRAWEGLLTQGNGYLHLRASFEEGLLDHPQNVEYERKMESVTVEVAAHQTTRQGVYIPAITGEHPAVRETVLNLPWFADIRISADGEQFDMAHSDVSEFSRTLDWRTGMLTRRVRWTTRSGAVIDLVWERFASQDNRHLFAQRLHTEVRRGHPRICWQSAISADVVTNGHRHFPAISTGASNDAIECTVITDKGDEVSMVSRVVCQTPQEASSTHFVTDTEAEIAWEAVLTEGQSGTLHKYTALTTSRDGTIDPSLSEDSLKRAYDAARDAADAGWDRLLAASAKRSSAAWEVGDRADQTSLVDVPHLRWATYHLLRCTPAFQGITQVCPKGFAGEAYYGRYFWDTEIFLFPFYLLTNPLAARGLLEYRYNTLDGARRNAREYNCRGAKYPWQSGTDGDEQCPLWEYADLELHVTADIAYALAQYVNKTNDIDFMWDRGVEILLETSRYWSDRVDWDSQGVPHLINVMGPDEYSPMTRDNAYTNRLVRFNLDQAIRWAGRMEREAPETWSELTERLGFRREELEGFAKISDRLPVPYDPERKLILQSADFEDYAVIDIDGIWQDRTKPFGFYATHETLYRSRCLKQADVVILLTLFPEEFDDEQVESAYEYYKPYTVHDSSLSPAAHVQVAQRLGKAEDIKEFVEKMIAVDFDLSRGGAADGMHIANCACIWQLADAETPS